MQFEQHEPSEHTTRSFDQRDVYASIAANSWTQQEMRSGKSTKTETTSLDFGTHLDLYGTENVIAQTPNANALSQELHRTAHNWKIPGQDDDYKGWKPGDKFDPKDFENWRESVRTYIAEFMKLNDIDPKSKEGAAFRNAFQHELAAAAFQKQSGANTFGVDAVGVGQEFYQAGKDILGIYGGASAVEAGGRIGNQKLFETGKKSLKENSDKLSTMFPNDTPVDLANNHKGSELAQTTNNWNELLKKLANSATQASEHSGIGQ
jgi:hypothetical protein